MSSPDSFIYTSTSTEYTAKGAKELVADGDALAACLVGRKAQFVSQVWPMLWCYRSRRGHPPLDAALDRLWIAITCQLW